VITFAYIANDQNIEFEKHLKVQSGILDAEVLWFREENFAKAYNEALKRAKNNVICFVREDVEIHSKEWGDKVLEYFEKTNYGILGIVGSIIVPMSGLVWEKEEPLVGHIWYEQFDAKSESKFSETFRGKVIPVVTVDDSFFVVDRRKLHARFDPGYAGDSFYDIDFCLANYEKDVKLGVFFDVKVLKLNFNQQDETWLTNRKNFVDKHPSLPFRIKPEIIMNRSSVRLSRVPKVGMIIACKGKPVELASCLESIRERSAYPDLEIVVVDLGSKETDLKAIREFVRGQEKATLVEIKNEHLPTVYEEVITNHLSNDIELISFVNPEIILLNDAISRMVKAYLEDPEKCGTLGVRMHTRSNMVRHFGLQLFSTETEDGFELGLGYQGFQSSYKYKNQIVKNILGSSRDFMMMSMKLYRKMGGFNKQFLHSLDDFEFNLKAILDGKRNVMVGNAVCYYAGLDAPKFLPEDFVVLVNFINKHVESITPYVELVYVAETS